MKKNPVYFGKHCRAWVILSLNNSDSDLVLVQLSTLLKESQNFLLIQHAYIFGNCKQVTDKVWEIIKPEILWDVADSQMQRRRTERDKQILFGLFYLFFNEVFNVIGDVFHHLWLTFNQDVGAGIGYQAIFKFIGQLNKKPSP